MDPDPTGRVIPVDEDNLIIPSRYPLAIEVKGENPNDANGFLVSNQTRSLFLNFASAFGQFCTKGERVLLLFYFSSFLLQDAMNVNFLWHFIFGMGPKVSRPDKRFQQLLEAF